MILDQELCGNAIEKYHEMLVEEKENKFELELLTGENIETLKQEFTGVSTQWEERAFVYLEQREKFVTNRK